jgi:hypothetical protein
MGFVAQDYYIITLCSFVLEVAKVLFDPQLLYAVTQRSKRHAQHLCCRCLVISSLFQRPSNGVALYIFQVITQRSSALSVGGGGRFATRWPQLDIARAYFSAGG